MEVPLGMVVPLGKGVPFGRGAPSPFGMGMPFGRSTLPLGMGGPIGMEVPLGMVVPLGMGMLFGRGAPPPLGIGIPFGKSTPPPGMRVPFGGSTHAIWDGGLAWKVFNRLEGVCRIGLQNPVRLGWVCRLEGFFVFLEGVSQNPFP